MPFKVVLCCNSLKNTKDHYLLYGIYNNKQIPIIEIKELYSFDININFRQ